MEGTFKVVITPMQKHIGGGTEKDFLNYESAKNFFNEWCDEHNYPYETGSRESGGIGFDFRIEIIEGN